MGISSYNFNDFISKIECVPAWESIFLAHEELTDVQRLLIREKTLTDTEREEISFYAQRLKDYVLNSRAILSSRSASLNKDSVLNL
jgi:hypothetical protein